MNIEAAYKSAQVFQLEEPTPLVREAPAGKPYPVEALGPLHGVVHAIHDKTQAPIAIAAQSVLSVAALATQDLADTETLHGTAPTSLFFLTIAESGERKSTCDRIAMAPVEEFEQELAQDRDDELIKHQNRRDAWEAERRKILGSGKGAKGKSRLEIEVDLNALGPEPKPPLFASIVSPDPTLEGLTKNLDGLRASLGLFTDEGGSFFGGHAMSSENRLKTVAGLSSFWDGKSVTRWRAGDGVKSYSGRRLSGHIQAQPVVAAEVLSDPVANGQGFLARFLTSQPESAIGTRTREQYDPQSDIEIKAFQKRIAELLRSALPLREGTRNELAPPILNLSAGARAILQSFSKEVELAQARGRELDATRPFASKAAEHAARLAAVLTLFSGVLEVSYQTMADATTLVSFYIDETVRIADTAKVSREALLAEKLRVWLIEKWAETHISVADVSQYGPNNIREAALARKLLRLLASEGWLHPCEGGAIVSGKRRKEAWIVHGRNA